MEFKQTQLPNGLAIVAEVNPAAASMATGFFVRTGSRDETPEVAGVSHFLEHMVFKGTERRNVFEVNRDFDEMGASYNAFTSEENTVYFGAVLPEFQERLGDLLGDILRPSLREEDFQTEKGVILEEIALYEDQPRFRVYDKLMASFFAGHPLGNEILGTPESIRAMKRDDMRAYFDRRYSPTNVTLVGVGNLDFDALVAKAEAMCGHWTPHDATRETPVQPSERMRTILHDRKVTREHVGLMSAAPAAQQAERYAAQLMATVVGDSTGSRLFYALIEPAIADEASMSYSPMDHAGGLITFLSADADRAAEAVQIAHREFATFQETGATDTELTAAKNKIASAATLKGEVPMGRLTSVGFDWVYRHQYVPLADQIDTLFAVTADEVLAVARECDLTSTTTLALGPLAEL